MLIILESTSYGVRVMFMVLPSEEHREALDPREGGAVCVYVCVRECMLFHGFS
jgi:hypothetical protein